MSEIPDVLEILDDISKVEDPAEQAELIADLYDALSEGPWAETLRQAEELSAQEPGDFDLTIDEREGVLDEIRSLERECELAVNTLGKKKPVPGKSSKARVRIPI